MTFDKRYFRPAAWTALILAGIALRIFIIHGLTRDVELCSADFLAFYSGGSLVGADALYSPEAAFAVQERALGCHHQNLVFVKPPFYALLMKPFAQLPFIPAFYLFRALVLAATAVFLWMWPGDRWALAAVLAWSVPFATVFTVGQDTVFVLAAAMGAYWMLRADRESAAGLLLGLCGIKFHLLFLLPVVVFRRKLWKTAAAGALVAAAWVALSFAAAGPDWVARYRAALSDSRMNPYAQNMVNLRGLLGYGTDWIWPASIAVGALCVYLIWNGSLEVSLAAAFAGGVLLTPHNTASDAVLFLPGLFLARRLENRVARVVALVALTPLYVFLPRGSLQLAIVLLMLAAAWTLKRPRAIAAAA